MPLQNHQYDTIMREYSRRQAANRRILEEHRKEACLRIPRLLEIDEQVATLSAHKARELLKHNESDISDLKRAISHLGEERVALLVSNGFPADYLELSYTCPKCQDTGYINSQKCTCFKRAEIELLYIQSNLNEILQKENFAHFSFEYYSDTIRSEKTGLSAYEIAHNAYNTAKKFVEDFDTAYSNLFLYGNTGVGKTFLSHCIAYELLQSAHSVLYFSAFDFFDMLAGNAFSSRKDSSSEDLIYDCDLLIIDDLGTELTNSFVSSQLFLCINERINRRKATIISTNLTLENFSDTYSERTFSRMASNYQLINLIGKDIRIQKMFLGGK